MTKHIIVTGGVVSSLGKGITAASLGRLIKSRGYKVTMQKMDPYLNVDPGTMSPFQHGEVFVTEDGHEGDLDLGHYERFIDENLTRESNFTQGSIYKSLIASERKGEFLGGTVQVIPHVTNAIQDKLYRISEQTNVDVVITEIGGTIGDIEGSPFIEAVRQFRKAKGSENVAFIHVSLVPYIAAAHEVKTKPTQHSVKELRSLGVQPDFIVLRSDHEIEEHIKNKIALFCDVEPEAVFTNTDLDSIYEIPEMLAQQHMDTIVLKRLGLDPHTSDMFEWNKYIEKAHAAKGDINIAVVGKYVSLPDAYLSVIEALKHAGVELGKHVNPVLIDGENLDPEKAEESLKGFDGILVPGGFGLRGIEGKIAAVKYAREHKIPFLGICLGMQVAVCEYARNKAGLTDANSAEFADDLKKLEHPVIHIMPEQEDITDKGGTMRLGSYPCKLKADSLAKKLYQEDLIYERHRHRYEVNNAYRDDLENAGLVISGLSPNNRLVEIVELNKKDHPFFIACQFHPEFKSRPTRPHPLFKGLIAAAIDQQVKGGAQAHV